MDTTFSSDKNLVIQINPYLDAGEITINGISSKRTAVYVFIPKLDGTKIYCPLNYFQDSCSLTGQWIYYDNQQKVVLDGVKNLSQVIVSIKSSDIETEINIPELIKYRFLEYFKLDIARNLSELLGFDCHAFICFLINIKCIPEIPCFKYNKKEPKVGEVVALCNREKLPESIKHWAVYLGDNFYLSKFGECTGSTDSHVAVMDIAGVHRLYKTEFIHIATPLPDAPKWDGKYRRTG